jgi:hypothetical protein
MPTSTAWKKAGVQKVSNFGALNRHFGAFRRVSGEHLAGLVFPRKSL